MKTQKDLLHQASPNHQVRNTQKKIAHSVTNVSNVNKNSNKVVLIQSPVKTNEKSNSVTKSLFEITNEIPGYQIFDIQLFENLSLYMQDLPGIYDLNKGLLFMGPIGCGKTMMMEILRNLGLKYDLKKTFRIENIRDIQTAYERSGSKIIDYFSKQINLCLDDIGTENLITKHFGNQLNLFEAIIEGFYHNSFKIDGKLLHGTSNLTLVEFRANYSSRVIDRMKEMFNMIIIDNPSFRK